MILLSRVSRTEEVSSLKFEELYFKLEVNSNILHVPVILGAFVPRLFEVLTPKSGTSVHYIDMAWKGKEAHGHVVHVHEMLPSSASLLSVPHASCLVVRILSMFDPAYLASGMFFTTNRKRSGFKEAGLKTAHSAIEKRLYDEKESTNDFTAYGPRYNAANLLHNVFGIVFDAGM